MTRTTTARTGLALLFLALPLTAPLAGQGLHVGPGHDPRLNSTRPVPPTPPGIARGLSIKSLDIKARIVDGIATTTLSQVFHNAGARIAEGTWILPLPEGATADHFTMTMNGTQVSGEVLDSKRARTVYENIVRRQRDPGLLEYMGNGCLRARVFPIPGNSDMKVEVRYRQVLPSVGGVQHWSFPLRAAHVHGRPADRINLDLKIESQKAIKNVYSPTAGTDVLRKGDHEARVSMELGGGRMARRDLDVFYGLSDQEFGLDLLTYRDNRAAGYFVMMLAPKLQWDDSKTMAKCINFVVDTSGSMNGEKIEQARGALRFFVNSLKEQDYFNVIPFSTEAQPFFANPQPADHEHIAKALDLIGKVEAQGGTNIEQALSTALSAQAPPVRHPLVNMTVFLTDGLPTVDTTSTDPLLKIISQSNQREQRIFVFGVGHDVNTQLLDKIAEQSHGTRDYVEPGEDIEVKTSALFTKLSHPVMTGVRIDCQGIEGFDIYPKSTPDLFKGSRLVLTGRYRGTGHHAIRLSGMVEGVHKTFVYEGTFPEHAEANDFIPTLWAQRKVAVLLDAIRLNGQNPELISAIRRLGREHGIVTPYTSHLILEEGQQLAQTRGRGRGARGGRFDGVFGDDQAAAQVRERLARDLLRAGEVKKSQADQTVAGISGALRRQGEKARKEMEEMSDVVGGGAVNRSQALRRLAADKNLGQNEGVATNLVTRHVKGHTFHLIDGVWIDGAFDETMKDKVEEVQAFSEEYFDLLKRHPELAKILALSSRMLVVVAGRAVEIL